MATYEFVLLDLKRPLFFGKKLVNKYEDTHGMVYKKAQSLLASPAFLAKLPFPILVEDSYNVYWESKVDHWKIKGVTRTSQAVAEFRVTLPMDVGIENLESCLIEALDETDFRLGAIEIAETQTAVEE